MKSVSIFLFTIAERYKLVKKKNLLNINEFVCQNTNTEDGLRPE